MVSSSVLPPESCLEPLAYIFSAMDRVLWGEINPLLYQTKTNKKWKFKNWGEASAWVRACSTMMNKYEADRWNRKGSGDSLFYVKRGASVDVKTAGNGLMWEASTAIRGLGVIWTCAAAEDHGWVHDPSVAGVCDNVHAMWTSLVWAPLQGQDVVWVQSELVQPLTSHHRVAPEVIQVQKRWPCPLPGQCGRVGPNGVGMGELDPPIAGHRTRVSLPCNLPEKLGRASPEQRCRWAWLL